MPDPALNILIETAERESPTLAKALARIDEARANTDASQSAFSPKASTSLSSTRSKNQSVIGAPQTSSSASLNFSWELDLFGRLRHNAAAAKQRLQASELDAVMTRLSLQTQVADTVMSKRACDLQLGSRSDDIRSRRQVVELTSLRQSVGQVAPVETARAKSSLADAQTNVASTQAQCAQYTQSLIALTGLTAARVDELLAPSALPTRRILAEPPRQSLGLPATILAQHPGVIAALRTADAAFEDIGSAEAARWPSLSLATLLGSNWLRAAGMTTRYTNWSIGPSASANLWDGGSSRANADAARARHAQALASLNSTLRSTVQDVENALAQLASAEQREDYATTGLAAAHELLSGSEASYRAGRMSLFELEDARRTFNNAQTSLINAQRDRAQAWIQLVKSTGNGLAFTPSIPPTSALAAAPVLPTASSKPDVISQPSSKPQS